MTLNSLVFPWVKSELEKFVAAGRGTMQLCMSLDPCRAFSYRDGYAAMSVAAHTGVSWLERLHLEYRVQRVGELIYPQ
jgi:hypothetical protein